MNFFEAQDRARKNTVRLVLLFVMAVCGLILLTNYFLLSIYTFAQTDRVVFSPETLYYFYTWKEFTMVTVGVCLFILAGSLYKIMSLAGGGPTIAMRLGGRLVSHSTRDFHERQLLNLVDEMAIAAGMPIPQVYLLNETSINAFAAGLTPASAVIGITKGALQRLDRDELQGVIAHEFSHIANGDMRLNVRLIGLLHGILLIGLMGYLLFRSLNIAMHSRSSKALGVVFVIAAVGLGLMIIGYAGSFFGQWIKAVVSRQREYLADSSAVQFTRNMDGIVGALKKIGGTGSVGSCLGTPSAVEYSHAYFCNGISSIWQGLFATHPALGDRIRKIEPGWDGQFMKSEIKPDMDTGPVSSSRIDQPQVAITAAALTSVEQAISQVGTLNEQNIEYVHQLIVAMPLLLREASQDVYSARGLVYAILIGMQKDQGAAFATLETAVDPDLAALTKTYLADVSNLEARFRLPLLELSACALRESSPNQFVQFKTVVLQIMASDRLINIREWVVQRFLLQELDEYFGFRKPAATKYANLEAVKDDVQIILSLIAHIEHKNNMAAAAFSSGAREAQLQTLKILPETAFKLDMLDRALDNLMQLKPLVKPRLLKACVAIIFAGSQPTAPGIELVRTISTCLNCPMPPLRPAETG